jgi:hypothetical protein
VPEPINATAVGRNFAPRGADFVHTVVLDGEGVLLDEQANKLHLLNHTATLLWQLYDGVTTLDELANDISEELGIDHETVVADLVAITRRLGAEGLIDGVAPSSDAGEDDPGDEVGA